MAIQPDLRTQEETLTGLLDDLSRPEEAADRVADLGERAVPILRTYLRRPAQSVPQARQRAVRLLGMVGSPGAHEALRGVLMGHDLAGLDPVLALSESVVKNEAAEQLVRAGRCDLAGDLLAAFRRDRLPAAAAALGLWHVLEGLPDLVTALESDLVGEVAAEALIRFGTAAGPELTKALEERHGAASGTESRISRLRRIRAALLLAEMGGAAGLETLRGVLQDENPSVRAAAALGLWRLDPGGTTPGRCQALLRGALSPERRVRERCRDAVQALGEACVPAALDSLAIRTVPDLYGVPVTVTRSDQSWVVRFLMSNPFRDPTLVHRGLLACDQGLLADGLARTREVRAAGNVAGLRDHPNLGIRILVARVLGRIGSPAAVAGLVEQLKDPSRKVRRAAARSLGALAAEDPGLVRAGLSGQAKARSWLVRWRIWRAVHRHLSG